MKNKIIMILIIIISNNSFSQIWQYPFGIINSKEYKNDIITDLIGIKSIKMIRQTSYDTICSYINFDENGKTIFESGYGNFNDTTIYIYDENDFWIKKVTNNKTFEKRKIVRDDFGKITCKIYETQNNSDTIRYYYNSKNQINKIIFDTNDYKTFDYQRDKLSEVQFFSNKKIERTVNIFHNIDTITYISCYYNEDGKQYPSEKVSGVFKNDVLTEIFTETYFTEKTGWNKENWNNFESNKIVFFYDKRGQTLGYLDTFSNGNTEEIKGFCNQRGDRIKQEIYHNGIKDITIDYIYEYY